MNIYSIAEIVKATNNFLEPKYNKTQEIKQPVRTKNIIKQEEKSILQKKNKNQNFQSPLVLKNKTVVITDSKSSSVNYKIKIKPEVKDRMINELYIFLKKKVKKNTLKLIIDEQIEIKNLNIKINLLKENKNELIDKYEILNNSYENSLENYKQLNSTFDQLDNENKELKINYSVIQNNLNQTRSNNNQLNIQNKELKFNNEILQNNLNQVNDNSAELNIENKELKIELKETKHNLNESLTKIRPFEINNAELKNTISRYIVNTKKIQEKLDLLEKSKSLEIESEIKKVKFYQDENIRLSSELLMAREKNETIKQNLNNIETEKEKIAGQIKELSNSIDGKTNILSTPFLKKESHERKEDVDKLNDKEQKSLDEVINRIFAKI